MHKLIGVESVVFCTKPVGCSAYALAGPPDTGAGQGAPLKRIDLEEGMTVSLLLLLLILLPALTAVVLAAVRNEAVSGLIVRIAAGVIALLSVLFSLLILTGGPVAVVLESAALRWLILLAEAGMGVFIFVLGVRHKKYLASLLVLIQTPLIVWFGIAKEPFVQPGVTFYMDTLTVIMTLIVGVIGSVICVYAVGYMKDYHSHPEEGIKDRRPLFFSLMFIFLSAMFGIVFSNDLVWFFFFWEITTLCSFLLIGYSRKPEAVNNAFRAVILNTLGGIAFAVAIVYMGLRYDTVCLDRLMLLTGVAPGIAIPVMLLAFAGLTKAAQMPFSSWLLGAMVAPTPVSALLHSATMVKAGVYLLIRLAPALEGTLPGLMVTLVGGFTFMVSAFLAISQSNAKKVLAYSTVSNLGLIVTCAGLGSFEALWAADFLIIFHAVTKSLLFMCVGTGEHGIGSRDIEDMDGLFSRMPQLARFMVIGIAGMFLAPFGMLISKWATMKAFIDARDIFLIIFLIFGSAATLFFWAKWLGKLTARIGVAPTDKKTISVPERFALTVQSVSTMAVCFLFPVLSTYVVTPYLVGLYGPQEQPISQDNIIIMVCMLALVIILPFSRKLVRKDGRRVPLYMGGINEGDDLHFQGSLGVSDVSQRNWYMEKYFGEKKLSLAGTAVSAAIIVVAFAFLVTVH